MSNPFESPLGIHLKAALLCTVARWWLDVPQQQYEKLAKLRAATRPETDLCTMAPGNKAMLRQFEDRDLADKLLRLPGSIAADFAHRTHVTYTEACRLEKAAIVAWLLATAVRPKNAATTILGKNAFQRSGKWQVYYPKSEVKNKIEIAMQLPAHTAEVIDVYLRLAHPTIGERGNKYLFKGRGGKHKNIRYFGRHIGVFMRDELGVYVTAHRFRHVAGFLFLQDNPNGYEVVRLLLGHKSINTTIKYYVGAEVKAAHDRWDQFVRGRIKEIDDISSSGSER